MSSRNAEERGLHPQRPRRGRPPQPASVVPGMERVAWTADEDLVGPLGSELSFLARNLHGLGIRFSRGAGTIVMRLASGVLGSSAGRASLRWGGWWLRGASQDRLELLGEEYFESVVRPRITREHHASVAALRGPTKRLVLVTHALDCVARPLAAHLGLDEIAANRLELRNQRATGRFLDPLVAPGNRGKIPLDRLEPRPVAAKPASPRIVLTSHAAAPLSVRATLEGKTILLVGVTGFIGKVYVAKLLRDVPRLARIVLLVRPRPNVSARERVDRILEESPVFDVLRQGLGADAARFLSEKIVVVGGDVSLPRLGLDASFADELASSVDVVVNCAGLTEFNPDLREALATNVDSSLHLLDFVRASKRAALLHVSTCFVAGVREGRVPEVASATDTPAGTHPLDAHAERERLGELVREETEKAAARVEVSSAARSRRLRDRLVEAGLTRARELGWPNIYTYTKGLGEALVEQYGADLPITILRPSIVESAREFPFRGWNEGINTSAPLSYVLGTWFRQLPVRICKRLDVIPVDDVVRGMTLVTAALVERRAPRVVQLATSVTHPLDMRRAVELTALAHRRHYAGEAGWKSWALTHLEAIPVSRERYERLSVPAQAAFLRFVNRAVAPFTKRTTALQRLEKNLARVRKLIDLYEPFILRDEHVFEAEEIERLAAALPEEERATFGYDVSSIDWARYWTEVHIPGLRRWSYPLIEGREPVTRVRRGPGTSAGDRAEPIPATRRERESWAATRGTDR